MVSAEVGFSIKCASDIYKLNSPAIKSCQQLFHDGKNLDDLLSYNLASAKEFCRNNCQKLVPDLLNRLLQDCGFPVVSGSVLVRKLIFLLPLVCQVSIQ